MYTFCIWIPFFTFSVVKFYGISGTSPGTKVIPFEEKKTGQKSVHLEFVGASDTAGYCVDGTPDTSDLFLPCYKKEYILGWNWNFLH